MGVLIVIYNKSSREKKIPYSLLTFHTVMLGCIREMLS